MEFTTSKEYKEYQVHCEELRKQIIVMPTKSMTKQAIEMWKEIPKSHQQGHKTMLFDGKEYKCGYYAGDMMQVTGAYVDKDINEAVRKTYMQYKDVWQRIF